MTTARIAVVGGGRMGLPLACVLSQRGAHVTVCDINSALVDSISAGRCPYEEPGLPELMAELYGTGRLSATVDTAAAVSRADAVVVIVPAHLTGTRDIDLSILISASRDIGKGLAPGTLVIYETTVAVGTTRQQLVPALESSSGLSAGKDFHVAYSPERVKANLVLSRLKSTPKVVGGWDDKALAKASVLYRQYLDAPIDEVGSLEAAEMTKLLGMIFRDVNIALANELAAFCELSGVDFDRVRAAANTDGEANLLMPGIGVGGHCTPIYPNFLIRASRKHGLTQRLSEAAREVNDQQPARELQRLANLWAPLSGRKVHLLGLGFRPDVKVDAFSPAYTLQEHLKSVGAVVSLEDPYYNDAELQEAGFDPGAVRDVSVVVLNTAHAEFLRPDFTMWRSNGVEVVLDGRNVWNQDDAEAAGILYLGVGRPSRLERS
jgi:nucleotide sugar dehydrogenase